MVIITCKVMKYRRFLPRSVHPVKNFLLQPEIPVNEPVGRGTVPPCSAATHINIGLYTRDTNNRVILGR